MSVSIGTVASGPGALVIWGWVGSEEPLLTEKSLVVGSLMLRSLPNVKLVLKLEVSGAVPSRPVVLVWS